jgi:hypothetical protein
MFPLCPDCQLFVIEALRVRAVELIPKDTGDLADLTIVALGVGVVLPISPPV